MRRTRAIMLSLPQGSVEAVIRHRKPHLRRHLKLPAAALTCVAWSGLFLLSRCTSSTALLVGLRHPTDGIPAKKQSVSSAGT